MRMLPQVREHGIRANSISLCVTENGATRIQLENTRSGSATCFGKTLLARVGGTEEVANIALFLSSGES